MLRNRVNVDGFVLDLSSDVTAHIYTHCQRPKHSDKTSLLTAAISLIVRREAESEVVGNRTGSGRKSMGDELAFAFAAGGTSTQLAFPKVP